MTDTLSPPAGYRLVPDAHIDAIEHALMRHIRHCDRMPDPDDAMLAHRDAAVAALRAINQTLADIWTQRGAACHTS